MKGDSRVYRPNSFKSFHGQETAKENLRVAVISATRRSAPVPHILLAGASGLGKSTLARIVATERGTELTELNAVTIDKPADLVAPLLQLDDNCIIFIDEIHALKRECEEYLYTAMEDRRITIAVGEGKDPVVTTLAPFTLMGATTREGMLTKPMRDRFVLSAKLEIYTDVEMTEIIKWSIAQFEDVGDVIFDPQIPQLLAPFCYGVARAAQRFLVAMRDHAIVYGDESDTCPLVTVEFFHATTLRLGYRPDALNIDGYKYLQAIRSLKRKSGVGIQHIAKVLDEDVCTVEEVIEPWLLRQGYVVRTSSGRVITELGVEIL